MSHPQISASILNADFGRLGDDVARAAEAGVDSIHLDVMDGHFVDNLTFGPVVVEAVRDRTDLPFHAHLMIEHPLAYADRFAEAGSDLIVFHVEAEDEVGATLEAIVAVGRRPGPGAKPGDRGRRRPPVARTHRPSAGHDRPSRMGWPGVHRRRRSPSSRDLRAEIDRRGLDLPIGVDGGVNLETIGRCGRGRRRGDGRGQRAVPRPGRPRADSASPTRRRGRRGPWSPADRCALPCAPWSPSWRSCWPPAPVRCCRRRSRRPVPPREVAVRVTQLGDDAPLEGVALSADGTSVMTDATGSATLTLLPGRDRSARSSAGHDPASATVPDEGDVALELRSNVGSGHDHRRGGGPRLWRTRLRRRVRGRCRQRQRRRVQPRRRAGGRDARGEAAGIPAGRGRDRREPGRRRRARAVRGARAVRTRGDIRDRRPSRRDARASRQHRGERHGHRRQGDRRAALLGHRPRDRRRGRRHPRRTGVRPRGAPADAQGARHLHHRPHGLDEGQHVRRGAARAGGPQPRHRGAVAGQHRRCMA